MKSKNILGKFLEQHPEVKTASKARDILLSKGIGSEQDLEAYKNFDFGTNE